MNQHRLSTLAIGTEITDGQISDRNSQWLSARAVEMGYEIIEHRAVPDDRAVILRSLRELSEGANLILVTGGLGPTSDDFTRECVAEFAAEPLEWHEPSWTAILERLKLRGATTTENQKQQCFYPRGAKILRNHNGTANGFIVTLSSGTRVVSLPGPPSEIEGIWNDSLRSSLEIQDSSNARTLTLLRTMGIGEGALASRVEEIIDETICETKLPRPAVGYRATAPYVEVKLWAYVEQVKLVEQIAERIRREFCDVLINEGEQDLADAVLSQIAFDARLGRRTLLVDRLTQGEVITRLFRRAKDYKDPELLQELFDYFTGVIGDSKPIEAGLASEKSTTVLELSKASGDLEIRVARGAREKYLTLPKLAANLSSERGRKWVVESALREWGSL